ncbi:MAG TPA: DUF3341 domain-containing protein [Planctomycetes bacterium]|nr:DUF3341 domain-containing protein [Planctomycetota bacterium]
MKRRPKSGDSFGFLAEFAGTEELLEAIHACKAAGHTRMEAYTPMPVHEVWDALGHKSHLPKLVLGGGITGGILGFGMQYFASVIHYPINVGGRPLNSWPSFIIITFEMTILFAALTAVFGMLLLNGLPRPHHPVFDVEEFEEASQSRFFLLVPWYDPSFDHDKVPALLESLSPLSLNEVHHP